MPGPPGNPLDWPAGWDPTGGPSGAPGVGWPIAAATVGLSVAAVLSPFGVALLAATGAAVWQPLAAGALIALLVLAPSGAGLAALLLGLHRFAGLAEPAGSEAALAVLRVLVAALLFGHAVALAAAGRDDASPAGCLAVAAPWLVVSWSLLLCVMLWPVAPAVRRYGAILLDTALLSAFLHFGGRAVAGWYPLYLLLALYAGRRLGLAALAAAAGASICGFAAVVASTPVWRQQPILSAGLLAALGVVPALPAAAIRAIAMARQETAAATAGLQRTLRLIADALRGPLAAARPSLAAPRPVRPAGASLDDIADFAVLEAGTFAPPVEIFDPRVWVKRSLLPLQTAAAARGIRLRWRIDARLPGRLRGQAQAFERVLTGLARYAIETAPAGTVRLMLDAVGGDAERVELRLRVEGFGLARKANSAADEVPLALSLAERLLKMAGGTLSAEQAGGRPERLVATMPLAAEEGMPLPPLDLAHRPVVIATDDDRLAADLAELLAAWNGNPRWPGDAEEALADLDFPDEAGRPIMIVDGRSRLLSALSLAHHAARRDGEVPFVVLIAEEAQIASLDGVDEGELDGFIPAPVTERLLARALHALPLAPQPPPRAKAARHAAAKPWAAEAPADETGAVTPSAGHPKSPADSAAPVDARVVEALRSLGGGQAFLREVIESFRAEARQALRGIEEAVAVADPAIFARHLAALQRAAGNLGGVQLCEVAASLSHLTVAELRQHGARHAQRLAAEIERLAGALLEFLPAAEAGQ